MGQGAGEPVSKCATTHCAVGGGGRGPGDLLRHSGRNCNRHARRLLFILYWIHFQSVIVLLESNFNNEEIW